MKTISLLGAAAALYAAAGLVCGVNILLPAKFDTAPLVFLLIFLAVSLCFCFIIVKFKIKTAYACAGFFALSFLFQSLLSANMRIVGESDLRLYYDNALRLYQNSFRYVSLYSAAFPGNITYPALLALCFKIFGVHRAIPVLLNQFAMSATVAVIYPFMRRRHGALGGAVCAALLAVHPFVIIYCGVCSAEILYCACVIWCFVSFGYAMDKFREAGARRYFAIPALFLGFSVFFRPLGVILLAALLIYLLFFSGIKFRASLAVCAVPLAGFVIFSLISGAVVKQVTTYDAPKSSFGWNLYVGASAAGKWNPDDSAEFDRVLAAAQTPTEIQAYFAGAALARYGRMGPAALWHGFGKFYRWYAAEYVAQETALVKPPPAPPPVLLFKRDDYIVPVILYYIPILFLAAAFCAAAFIRAFFRKRDEFMVLALYTAGSFAAFNFLELAPRYTVSYHIMFTLLAFELAVMIVKPARRILSRDYQEYQNSYK